MTLIATSGVTVESVKIDGGTMTGVTLTAASNVIEADTLTNATLTTALTVNTGTLTLTADVANNSVLTLGAGASSISGANTGDNTVATSGDSATDFFDAGEIVDARISDTLTSSTCTGNAATVTTNANLTGEVTSVGNAATIADSITVTGWVLGTSSATQITSPTLITDLLDVTGAADMDYGSIDVLDHTFITDGTGTAEIVLPAGSIDGTEILDDTIDSADYAAGSIDTEHLATAVLATVKDNILMNAFRIAINGSLVKYNMVDGIMDEFEDESGVDTATSTNEDYDSSNDLYSPTSEIISNGDIDDEDMADISDWADDDVGDGDSSQVTFDSKSCMKLDSGSAGSGNYAYRSQDIGAFGTRTVISMNVYCDTIGLNADVDSLQLSIHRAPTQLSALFSSDGLFIYDGSSYNEVGTNLVVQDTWQEWTFDINWTAETVDVYLDGVLKASGMDCSFASGTVKLVQIKQYGHTTADMLSYIDWFKAGSDFATDTTQNMTLVSNSTEAEANPDNIRMFIVEEGTDITLNSNFYGEVSRDNGANWVTLTLVDEGDIESSMRILSATGSVAGQAADKTIKWRIRSTDNDDFEIHAVGLTWD